jgi:uncharacterized protein YbcV (DUF1398 family)
MEDAMDSHVKDVMVEATRASDEERVTFAEVVRSLIEAGVERYHADLQRGERTYYLPNGESEAVKGHAVAVAPAQTFSAPRVEAAVKAIQNGKIQYLEFCKRVAQAGCVGYLASMAGQRVVYYGRTGDYHVEWFPGAKREKAA